MIRASMARKSMPFRMFSTNEHLQKFANEAFNISYNDEIQPHIKDGVFTYNAVQPT